MRQTNLVRRAAYGALIGALTSLFAPASATAESGRYNLHLSGMGPMPAGGELAFDMQLLQPVAFEVRLGGGKYFPPVFQSLDQDDLEAGFYATAGARLRLMDDSSGFINQGGSPAGNLWLALHGGVLTDGDGASFMLDFGLATTSRSLRHCPSAPSFEPDSYSPKCRRSSWPRVCSSPSSLTLSMSCRVIPTEMVCAMGAIDARAHRPA